MRGRYWKRAAAALLLLCLLSGLPGCGEKEKEEAASPAPAPATAEASPAKPAPPPEAPPAEELTVYHCGGVEIPVPKEYEGLLPVDTELEPISEHWQPLISFTEKASHEAYAADYPGEDVGMGWLCGVTALDRIGFESWVSETDGGNQLFATDGAGRYYIASYPTDLRLYRPGGAGQNGEPPTDTKDWKLLTQWSRSLPELIVRRNGLTAYDAADLLDADYTYGGDHVELGYRTLADAMDLVLLALSQPVRQGEGGIWCVERVRYVYSDYAWTDTHLVFPAALGYDETAADYYARLQGECDAGDHPELLTPQGAALAYAKNPSVAWLFGEDVNEADLEVIESLG